MLPSSSCAKSVVELRFPGGCASCFAKEVVIGVRSGGSCCVRVVCGLFRVARTSPSLVKIFEVQWQQRLICVGFFARLAQQCCVEGCNVVVVRSCYFDEH
ncbi:uncharacterized protein HKW66_Vig0001570 [Vigna angularis]|uniref:Uncharacterized protein n=1 Tax=Phaseolus angularis TaxID=3914 RepID=A0A8T0LD38_PHAAN|nr:uncharacterized protein HKW66_Vig0001570 [Vigna angularis]